MLLPRLPFDLASVSHQSGQLQLATFAAHHHRHRLSCGDFAQKPPNLQLAVDDHSIQLQDDIVLAPTHLARRPVMIYPDNLRAARVFELQGRGFIVGDIPHINTQVARNRPHHGAVLRRKSERRHGPSQTGSQSIRQHQRSADDHPLHHSDNLKSSELIYWMEEVPRRASVLTVRM